MAKKAKTNNGTSQKVETKTQPVDIDTNDEFEPPEELDNPLRIVLIVNSPDVPDGELQERLMDYVQSMEDVDKFFNEFDEKVALPNEGHIKYEVGSDGLVVIVVDSGELKASTLKFIDEYNEKFVQA